MKRIFDTKLFYFILGFVLAVGTTVYATNTFFSYDVRFNPDNDEWNVKNVEEALNDLYSKNTSSSTSINVGQFVGFDYTGDYQYYDIPKTGNYRIELWGAQGGTSNNSLGYGGYVSGDIKLNKDIRLFIYVGNKPGLSDINYNGGGNANNSYYPSYDGGGATDVRIFNFTPSENDLKWDSSIGLNSRIIVAGGGGGANGWNNTIVSGPAGGLTGYSGTGYSNAPTGGTQTAGGSKDNAGGATNGMFGIGGNGEMTYGGGAGGGGYYGGGGASNGSNVGAGGGGSSYISGHDGCVAIDQTSYSNPRSVKEGCTSINDNNRHQCSIHFSNYEFTNTKMIDGKGCKWNSDVTNDCSGMTLPNGINSTGKTNNGYARITYLGN